MSTHSPGPWQMATSCSFRRIIDANGREIIGGTVQRSDGHPDLHFSNGGFEGPDARLVLAAPALLALVKRCASECKTCGGKGEYEIWIRDQSDRWPTGEMEACPACADLRQVLAAVREKP